MMTEGLDMIPARKPVKVSQALVDDFCNRSADLSDRALYGYFGLSFIEDAAYRNKQRDHARKCRARWREKVVRVVLDVPDVNDITRTTQKTVNLVRDNAKKTLEGIVSAELIKNAPLVPQGPKKGSKARKMSKKDVARILTAKDAVSPASFLDKPPPPTGRSWEGERWIPRKNYFDQKSDGLYGLDEVKSLKYEDCWERKPGFWWDEQDRRWRRGKVPNAYRSYYWYLTFWDNPAKYDEHHSLDELHKDISVTYGGGKRHLTLLERGSHKTSVFVEGIAGYLICEKQSKAKAGIFISCLDDKLSETTYNVITENLSENPRILSFYGYLIDHEKKSKYMGRRRKFTATECFFTYQTTGLRPGLKCMPFLEIKITGWHPYAVFLDDIQEKPLTDTYRKHYINIFTQRIIPAVGPKGNLFITGTIKGWDGRDETFNDIYLWLEDTPGYVTNRYPGVVDKDTGEAAFPDLEDVVRKKMVLPVYDDEGNAIILKGGVPYTEERDVIVEIKNRKRYKVNFPSVYTLEDLIYIRMEMKNDDKFFSEYQLQSSNPAGKFFAKDRIRPMREMTEFEHFHDVGSFKTYARKFGKKIALWVDPGGESAHGMSIVVMCRDFGIWFLLDCVVVKAGVPKTAEAIAKLLEKWNISFWGVEGNFTQKEFVGKQLRFFLRRYLEDNGKKGLYKPPVFRNNSANKIQRIRTGFSTMLGLEGMSYTFYYNPAMTAKERFFTEVREFGLDVQSAKRAHEFDLLDAIVSAETHILKGKKSKNDKGPICSGTRWKRATMSF
jgi:hypothetical protein